MLDSGNILHEVHLTFSCIVVVDMIYNELINRQRISRWMSLCRWSDEYLNGVEGFLEFTNASIRGEILCPCVKCNNKLRRSCESVLEQVIIESFTTNHTN